MNYFFSYFITSCNLKVRYRNIYFKFTIYYYYIATKKFTFFFLLGLEIISERKKLIKYIYILLTKQKKLFLESFDSKISYFDSTYFSNFFYLFKWKSFNKYIFILVML